MAVLASVSAKLVDSYNYGDDGDYDSNYFYTATAAFHSHLSSVLVVLCSLAALASYSPRVFLCHSCVLVRTPHAAHCPCFSPSLLV